MGGDFLSKSVSCRYEPHCCHDEWGNFPQTVFCRHEPHWCRAEWETFRKQFPAAVNHTGAAPDRKLSAIVSCRHEPQSYHTETEN